MINLHERLSEFSFGFGVTREVQSLLEGIGLRPTPFMPNLLHEEELGFVVGFKTGGGLSSCNSSSVTSFGAFIGRRRRTAAGTPILAIQRRHVGTPVPMSDRI